MARPKSEERRQAIVNSAIHLIAREGLGAATASIAKEAGVPNGSVFTYFPTKVDLLNALYSEIKEEMTAIVNDGLAEAGDEREQLRHMWGRWTHWGVANPEKRRALALLSVSDEVTAETKQVAFAAAHRSVDLLKRVARDGALRGQDLTVVGAIVDALASTTMNLMGRDAAQADAICAATFDMLWKALR